MLLESSICYRGGSHIGCDCSDVLLGIFMIIIILVIN